ncbi:hypothetical protein VTO42DRAFT_4642 [Malbranchea cinnamomea]
MARLRLLPVPFQARRSFATTAIKLQLSLAYQAWPTVASSGHGESNARPIIFMHGLFGSKQNNRSMSKVLASQLKTTVYAIDLRNHGDSPHHPEHNYSVMADDVEEFISSQKLERPVLIGHSMGAKAAMTVALRSPETVSAVISVDNSPVSVPLSSDFAKYVRGMKHIEEAKVTKQKEADEILAQYEESLPIRQFLLTNLIRSQDDNILRFRVPLQILGDSLDNMADFPYGMADDIKYDGPALFVKGTRSSYIREKSMPYIQKFFPNWQLENVEAGHWLISENPEAFKSAVVSFLRNVK